MPTSQISITILHKNTSQSEASLFMQPRQEGNLLKGRLEFPGGKIKPGETPQVAAARECFEECNIQLNPENLSLFKIYDVEGENSKVRLYVLLGEYSDEIPVGRWYPLRTESPLEGIEDQIMPANHQIITDAVNYLSASSELTSI